MNYKNGVIHIYDFNIPKNEYICFIIIIINDHFDF